MQYLWDNTCDTPKVGIFYPAGYAYVYLRYGGTELVFSLAKNSSKHKGVTS